jgi:hypothetical protein
MDSIENITNLDYIGQTIDDLDTFDILPDYLKNFYHKLNGFIAFQGGLHVRGCSIEPGWHSLREIWFGEFKLSRLFDSIEANDIPIAQDCFGDQFVIRMGHLWLLHSETDEITDLEIDFDQFIEQSFSATPRFLNIHNIQNLKLKPGQLINVVPPFCIDSKTGYSYKPIDSLEQIRYLSFFSKEIKKLPDGTTINLKTD